MKIKKITGIFLAAAMTAASVNVCFAAEENINAEIPQEVSAIDEGLSLAATGTAYTDDNIIGGSIYYNPETGEITSCGANVTSVIIPAEINGVKITGIGERAFYGCSGLTSITIPEGVTSIGDGAFDGCSDLTIYCYENSYAEKYAKENNIPYEIISKNDENDGGKYAVEGGYIYYNPETGEITDCDESVTSAIIPAEINGVKITGIGERAFYGCSGLTSIEIPEGVTSIGVSAFYGCSGLTSIEIPEGVTSIGSSAFYLCSGLTSIEIPEGVTSIGSSAFYGCSGLTSIEIPQGVTSIGDYAFSG